MPSLRSAVRRNTYFDSVRLMRVSEELAREPGVIRAAAVMATPLNLELLAADGLLPDGAPATPEDLLVAVLAEDEPAAERAMARLEALLRPRAVERDEAVAAPPRTLEAAANRSGGNLAVIAVPGASAALEALAALRAGMHVFLFSDNVPLEAEVRLKSLAAELDLLIMGPDCGTAILTGVGLGFTNRVRPGPVGIAGASGTGIQQVCCLLDAAGIGIAQAIGTGGRDLSAAVGGSMTIRAVQALDAEDSVEIVAVISKPADAAIARRLHAELLGLSKPVVACLLGETLSDEGNVRYATDLTHQADLIRETITGVGGRGKTSSSANLHAATRPMPRPGREGAENPRATQLVYGLYAGGTLCSEAERALDEMGVSHSLVDLGEDEYTRGRAHPIIDPRLRAAMLAELAGRSDIGAVLLDVILGDLAHPDPAGALLPSIAALNTRPDGPVAVFAAVIGTGRDPQRLERQREALRRAGVAVFDSNVEAARAAGRHVRSDA